VSTDGEPSVPGLEPVPRAIGTLDFLPAARCRVEEHLENEASFLPGSSV
jgi:hypothetical protein